MPEGHARLPPSGAARWVACPGSMRLQEIYPEREEGPEAQEGTRVHAILNAWLNTGHPPAGSDPEEIEGVKLFVDDFEARARGPRYFEERVDMPSIHADNWGTVDAYCLDTVAKVARLWDLKWGHKFVEVFENWQLLNYGVGVSELLDADWSFEFTIVQPRSYHPSGPVRTWAISSAELKQYARTLRVAAEEAMDNNPSTTPGPECDYCTARHACVALQSASLGVVERSYSTADFDLPPGALGTELRLLRRGRDLLDARISGLEAEAMAAIRGGVRVPFWTIEHTGGREEWTKDAEEVASMGDLMGVSLRKPLGLITPAQARKSGLSEVIVAAYSARKSGAAKLVPITTSAARAAFGGS